MTLPSDMPVATMEMRDLLRMLIGSMIAIPSARANDSPAAAAKRQVWHGHEVKIDLIYDEKSAHLLKAHLQARREPFVPFRV